MTTPPRTAGTATPMVASGGGGLLTGELAKAIYAGFRGKLLKGALLRYTPSTDLDDLGDPDSFTQQSWACEGFVDNYSAHTKAAASIPASDSKVCIFGKSLP